jgi:hypothetical protein
LSLANEGIISPTWTAPVSTSHVHPCKGSVPSSLESLSLDASCKSGHGEGDYYRLIRLQCFLFYSRFPDPTIQFGSTSIFLSLSFCISFLSLFPSFNFRSHFSCRVQLFQFSSPFLQLFLISVASRQHVRTFSYFYGHDGYDGIGP